MSTALQDFFRRLPTASYVRITRIAPAWSRGYLDDVDTSMLQQFGGINAYLRDTYGGERYSVELIDREGVPMGAGWILPIVGPPKFGGVVLKTPIDASTIAPTPVLQAAAPATIAYAAPAAPQQSQQPAIDGQQVQQLVELVRQLAGSNQALMQQLERLQPGAAGDSNLAGAFSKAREALDSAREFSDAVDQFSGGRRDEPEPEERHSPFARGVMQELGRGLGGSIRDMFAGGSGKGNGSGKSHAEAPAESAASDVIDADEVTAQ